MTKPLGNKLRALAYHQEGIVDRGQVIDAGLSPSAIRRRIRSGDWQRVSRGVYATFSGKSNREAKLWITILRAGPEAVLSHETAAELHGFAKPAKQIHVTVPAGRRPAQHRPLPGVVIHRSSNVRAEPHAAWVLPRTSPEDTVLDLISAASTFNEAYMWLCRAIGRGVTLPQFLREALSRRARFRWRAWIIEALAEKEQGLDSPLERRYVRDVERAHGLPAARRQARRRAGSANMYLDNLYEGYRLCVELDGATTHPIEGRWADTERDNENIASDDIRTLRFGWVAVTERRCQSAQRVADALRRSGWTGDPHPCGPECTVR
jgi:hypothetical protein